MCIDLDQSTGILASVHVYVHAHEDAHRQVANDNQTNKLTNKQASKICSLHLCESALRNIRQELQKLLSVKNCVCPNGSHHPTRQKRILLCRFVRFADVDVMNKSRFFEGEPSTHVYNYLFGSKDIAAIIANSRADTTTTRYTCYHFIIVVVVWILLLT
uniref:Rootletin n=1 Tax=Lygus hesperus TaxID=30085 RepID=A0A0A9YA64_LYGHE